MEESAPKRRRTSPRQDSQEAGSSQDAPRQPTPQSSPRRKRPSYASPTKASLEKFNPDILERRRSASPAKSPGRSPSRPTYLASQPLQARPRGQVGSGPATSLSQPERSGLPSRPIGSRGAFGAAPIGSPSIPSPRPFPPREEGEEFDPLVGREIRRTTQDRVEPDLPPSAPDPVASSSPGGIHSSPSKRWRFRVGEERPTSSPLKNPPTRPDNAPREPTKKPLKQSSFRNRLAQATSTVVDDDDSNVRKTKAFDVYSDRRKERDDLQAELARLQKELKIARKENERIRLMQASGRNVAPTDENAVIDIIKRHLLPHDIQQRAQSSFLAGAALNPMAIMPFGRKPAALPLKNHDEDYSHIKSHHPVVMTAADELPFLQLFTPFTVDARLATVPKANDNTLHQLFSIDLRSRQTPGLFSAQMDVEVDAMNLTIQSLHVKKLEPASRPELEKFISRICRGDCNRSMQRNVGIASWAMAEWLRVAEQRARFWSKLKKRTSTKQALQETSSNARMRRQKRLKEDQLEVDDEPVNLTELTRYMGQQAIDVKVPNESGSTSTLRMEWKIEFDWTGEAQSKLAVLVGVPGEWHNLDTKGSLGKVPSLFESLVQGGEEPVTAAYKILALLAGQN